MGGFVNYFFIVLLKQGSGSPMHIDPGLQSPTTKRDNAAGDGMPPSRPTVKEEPMQVEDKAKAMVMPMAKVTERVVSSSSALCPY